MQNIELTQEEIDLIISQREAKLEAEKLNAEEKLKAEQEYQFSQREARLELQLTEKLKAEQAEQEYQSALSLYRKDYKFYTIRYNNINDYVKKAYNDLCGTNHKLLSEVALVKTVKVIRDSDKIKEEDLLPEIYELSITYCDKELTLTTDGKLYIPYCYQLKDAINRAYSAKTFFAKIQEFFDIEIEKRAQSLRNDNLAIKIIEDLKANHNFPEGTTLKYLKDDISYQSRDYSIKQIILIKFPNNDWIKLEFNSKGKISIDSTYQDKKPTVEQIINSFI